MKIRCGFVSNSSSSSFVLGKNFMTEDQVKLFSKFCTNIREALNDESFWSIDDEYRKFFNNLEVYDYAFSFENGGSPLEIDYYFLGELDYSLIDIVISYLLSIGIDEKYIGKL